MLEASIRPQQSQDTLPLGPGLVHDPFIFVPITKTEAAKGRGNAKRIVRAHVARVQHAKSAELNSKRSLQPWRVTLQALPPIRRSMRSKGRRFVVERADSSGSSGSTSANSTSDTSIVTIPELPGARRIGAERQDPFWTYPVDYLPYLPAIFAHYIEHLAVNIPDVDGPNDKGLIRRVWFPLAMQDAATMYAVLLMAASHYCANVPGSLDPQCLLFLKSKALAEINAGLSDPERATTDAMIGAVMKMAAYEAIFGNSAVFATHMQGLGTMLTLRGGLSRLGLAGLLERMIVWIDFNAAIICGQEARFGKAAFPTTVKLIEPDLYHFAGIQ